MKERAWLDRSGQRWKTRGTWLPTLILAVVVLLSGAWSGAGSLPRWSAMTMLGLAVAGRLAGLLLPWLVRCPVCGVRIEDCSLARSRSGLPRSEWMDSLQACPVCGDDGNADIVAVRAWQASGREARESGSADPRAGKA